MDAAPEADNNGRDTRGDAPVRPGASGFDGVAVTTGFRETLMARSPVEFAAAGAARAAVHRFAVARLAPPVRR